MITLYLNDILKQIGNFSVGDENNFVVKWVETYPEYIKNYVVFFYKNRNKNLNPDSYKNLKCYAVVMEAPGEEKLEFEDNHITVKVNDIESAYWKFVEFYRNLFDIPVYGITGTCGKSTTKEMLKHVLTLKGKVQATRGSNNSNRLNLDYLLGIDEKTAAAVFELGVMFKGDIQDYCRYFKPGIGIITNIGIDHLRWIETFEDYVKAKTEILEGLSFRGTLIMNSDDENIMKIDLSSYHGKLIYYGKSNKADYKISNVSYRDSGMKFILEHENNTYQLYIPQYGEHNVYNAVAAIAAANISGISIIEAGESLKDFIPMPHHLQLLKGINSCQVLDDTWTSNYMSVNATLKVLDSLGSGKKKIALFGRMSSMIGQVSAEQYREIGREIAAYNIDILITRGEIAPSIAKSAVDYGFSKDRVFIKSNTDEIISILEDIADENTVVLICACWGDDFTDLLEKLAVQ